MTRRELLRRIGGGFGALGLAGAFGDAGLLGRARPPRRAPADPLAPRPPHFPARAKRVIFLFMNGGPSHVDTFDPKPALDEYDGQEPPEAIGRHRAEATGRLMAVAVHVRASTARAASRSASCFPEVGRLHRRPLRHPLDAHRQPQPRAGPAPDELGQHAADPAEPGLVADLRPGHREPEPARLRRPLPRQAGRRPAALEQQLPARRLPGHAHQQPDDRPATRSSATSATATSRRPPSASSSTCCRR